MFHHVPLCTDETSQQYMLQSDTNLASHLGSQVASYIKARAEVGMIQMRQYLSQKGWRWIGMDSVYLYLIDVIDVWPPTSTELKI